MAEGLSGVPIFVIGLETSKTKEINKFQPIIFAMLDSEQRNTFRLLKPLIRIVIILFVYFSVIVVNQDLLIFPGVVRSKLAADKPTPPEVIESFLFSKTGRRVNIWKLPAEQSNAQNKKVVLILHGNGGDVKTFFHFQEWFKNLGYTSYDFDYPGYGKSTGWMSEKRIYHDAESVLRFVASKENIQIGEILIFGISVGSGPASYLAQLVQSKSVMIASGYSSIPDVVKTRFLFWFLAPLVRYTFPTADHLRNLKNSCVILTHGKRDEVIGYENALRLKEAASKYNEVKFISSDMGGHNDTFWEKAEEIKTAIGKCWTAG